MAAHPGSIFPAEESESMYGETAFTQGMFIHHLSCGSGAPVHSPRPTALPPETAVKEKNRRSRCCEGVSFVCGSEELREAPDFGKDTQDEETHIEPCSVQSVSGLVRPATRCTACHSCCYNGAQAVFATGLVCGFAFLITGGLFHTHEFQGVQILKYIGVLVSLVCLVLLIIFCSMSRKPFRSYGNHPALPVCPYHGRFLSRCPEAMMPHPVVSRAGGAQWPADGCGSISKQQHRFPASSSPLAYYPRSELNSWCGATYRHQGSLDEGSARPHYQASGECPYAVHFSHRGAMEPTRGKTFNHVPSAHRGWKEDPFVGTSSHPKTVPHSAFAPIHGNSQPWDNGMYPSGQSYSHHLHHTFLNMMSLQHQPQQHYERTEYDDR